MPFDLLHFGTGNQAWHYLVYCYIAIIGTLQAAATRSNRCDLLWFQGRAAYWFGGLLVAGGTFWFLLFDEEIFIPGLAGGELFAIFATAFILALSSTRFVNLVIIRLRLLVAPMFKPEEESLP